MARITINLSKQCDAHLGPQDNLSSPLTGKQFGTPENCADKREATRRPFTDEIRISDHDWCLHFLEERGGAPYLEVGNRAQKTQEIPLGRSPFS
ncbi:hypothetical protein P0D69_42590 [Paraburkholderia sediminicola]|uniref:hypothetical protein n=1 Tax=Paraburkholderia sediminicola TaxID=458836 RepID=UPI0038B9B283